jgi:tight adherence protein C
MLPYALDLLTLSVEAGLDFTAALARLVPKLRGTALAAEFGAMLRDIQLGKPRTEALRDMADRISMNEVNSFAAALIQADELGASIGVVLRVQADQMRNDRSNRAEKKAMEAPVKILFPLIACIFPTVFLIIFAPILIKYLPKILH